MSMGGSSTSTEKTVMAKSQAGLDAANAASTGVAEDTIDFVNDFFDTYIKPSIAKLNTATDTAMGRNDELYAMQKAQAIDREKTYQTEGKKAVTDFMTTARDFSSDAYGEQQAALAIGDVNNQAQIAEQTRTRQLDARGINPTSGAAIASMDQTRTRVALAKAAESSRARKMAVDLGLNLKDRAAQIGDAQGRYSTPMIAQAGSLAGQGAGLPAAALESTKGAGQPVTQGYGIAADIYGGNANRYASQYDSAFRSKSQKDSEESAGWGKLAGTVIGIGAKAAFGLPGA